LESYSEHLEAKGWIRKETFEHEEIELTSGGVQYKDISAKKVIFSEGFGLLKNPFFNYLPLRGNKGEYIFIKAPGLDLNVGVKSSIFIFPAGGDHYAVGATYSNTDKTPEPTAAARQELVEKLKDLIKIDFEVIDQVAGLRPSTIDRRPLVGNHPDHNALYTCNGFGSRGILIAPSISGELIDHIEDRKPLDPEIDISRFTKKWYKKN
jgi:glycine/D-amino acid oxidase-like deaminating enzyme